VVYVACDGFQQRASSAAARAPTRAPGRWCCTAPGRPVRTLNVSPTTLTPAALTGNISLTASAKLFKRTHVGALFSVTSVGQA
jgi:hypothetical protein